jgi:hypothetical protein
MTNNEYYKSNGFMQHRDKIIGILESVPVAENPKDWF